MSEVFYHGTNTLVLRKIKKRGILPNNQLKKRDWVFPEKSKACSVYLTTNLASARNWAEWSAHHKGGFPVVLKILREAIKGEIILDENFNLKGSEEFRVQLAKPIKDFEVLEIIKDDIRNHKPWCVLFEQYKKTEEFRRVINT